MRGHGDLNPSPQQLVYQPLLSDEEVAKLKTATVEAMQAVGVDPALTYAYERTGLIITRENRKRMSAADLDEWEDAIAEYRERHP
jgi:hypothetical protein